LNGKLEFTLVVLGLLFIGGLVGHFAFPNVTEVLVEVPTAAVNNSQYGTFNACGLQVELDERTGNLSISGLRPGNLWIGDVDGFSMWPALRNHSAVIIEEVQPHDEVLVGDIVVFDDPTGVHDYIIHRVIEVGTDDVGWYAVTVGDNQEESTEWVPWYYTARRDEIWGKARIYIDY